MVDDVDGQGGRDETRKRAAAVLLDYDNFYPGELQSRSTAIAALNRMTALALEHAPGIDEVSIRLYGGWLDNGVLTKRGSHLQAELSGAYFPLRHPRRLGVLRGSVELVTRLAGVPSLEWKHTYRQRKGLPRLRLADGGRPRNCPESDGCPIDLLQRMSRSRARTCHVPGCDIVNEHAFQIDEQKMVDSLICCDAVTLAASVELILVLSNDLDVLPGIALAASTNGAHTVLVRDESDTGLYAENLERLGVSFADWSQADVRH